MGPGPSPETLAARTLHPANRRPHEVCRRVGCGHYRYAGDVSQRQTNFKRLSPRLRTAEKPHRRHPHPLSTKRLFQLWHLKSEGGGQFEEMYRASTGDVCSGGIHLCRGEVNSRSALRSADLFWWRRGVVGDEGVDEGLGYLSSPPGHNLAFLQQRRTTTGPLGGSARLVGF